MDIRPVWGHDWGHISGLPQFVLRMLPKFHSRMTNMAKIIKPLSSIQVRNAKPKDKSYKLFDGGGLYLEVFPTGSRFWRANYNYFLHGEQ